MLRNKVISVHFVRNFARCRDCFGTPTEKFRHFVARFEIKLVGVETRAVYFALLAAERYAHHGVLNVGVFLFYVVNVVCGNHFHAYFSCDLHERIHDDSVFGQMMVLKFDIKITGRKRVSHLDCNRLCFFVFSFKQKTRNLPSKTRRKANQTFAVFLYMLEVYTRLDVKTVNESH